jgi:hypothetical protein
VKSDDGSRVPQQIVGYRKTYRLRMAVPGSRTLEVTFPYMVVEKEARNRDMTIDDFLDRFQAVCEYGGGLDGVLYRIEEIEMKARLKGGQDVEQV